MLPVILGFFLIGPPAYAADDVSFEVASVKPADAQARGLCTGGPGTSDPGTFSCPHVSLAALIYRAYDLEFQFYRFKPTDWMETTWFTVVAKVPAGTTRG
jgi:uncharacterized protein (TIGR03435 family)